MHDIVKNMIGIALKNHDKELANLAYQLMQEFATNIRCDSEWRILWKEMAEEFKDSEWVQIHCQFDEFDNEN